MTQQDINNAIELWLLAENFNREEFHDEAFKLKLIYSEYIEKLSKSGQAEIIEIIEYLDSVGA